MFMLPKQTIMENMSERTWVRHLLHTPSAMFSIVLGEKLLENAKRKRKNERPENASHMTFRYTEHVHAGINRK